MGTIFVALETPPGTGPEGTLEVLARDEQWWLEQPEVAGLFGGSGFAGPEGGLDPTRGIMFIMLKHERERSAQDLIAAAREALGRIPGQQVRISDMSGMAMSSDHGQFEVELLGNVEIWKLAELGERFLAELKARGGFVDMNQSLKLGRPELRVIPRKPRRSASTPTSLRRRSRR
jgi:multidrug efflux pump subunit AcrB